MAEWLDVSLFACFIALMVTLSALSIWIATTNQSGTTTTTTTTASASSFMFDEEPSFLVDTEGVHLFDESWAGDKPWLLDKSCYFVSKEKIDSTYDFMMKYFPVEETSGCANRDCKCGKQARVETVSDGGLSFGLHAVYAAGGDNERLRETTTSDGGDKSLLELENIFNSKFGNMDRYVPEFETNTGLWTDNIQDFVNPLHDDDVPFYALAWADEADQEFISIFVNPPGTQIIYEIVSYLATADDWLVDRADITQAPRFFWGSEPPVSGTGLLTALWVSRITTDLARDKDYFYKVLLMVPGERETENNQKNTHQWTGKDANGVEFQGGMISPSSWVTIIRLVETKGYDDDEYGVAWAEEYIMGVHQNFMASATCGWDIVGDNHYGVSMDMQSFDMITSEYYEEPVPMMQAMIDQIGILGYQYFCRSGSESGDDISWTAYNGELWQTVKCYIIVPNGWCIQLDGYWPGEMQFHQYSTAELCATYNEFCLTEDGPESLLAD